MFIFFFLLNFLVLALFGRLLSKEGVKAVTLFNLLCAICFTLTIFIEGYLTNNIFIVKLFTWMILDNYYLLFSLNFDFISTLMATMVIIIASIVHVYSFEYMDNDPHFIRFISYLSLFTFFMLILITASNLIQVFLGWEGVGICSYLLVNFWFLRVSANKASIKAILVNRIGDCALLLAILIILSIIYHLDFSLFKFTYNLNFFENLSMNIFFNSQAIFNKIFYAQLNIFNNFILIQQPFFLLFQITTIDLLSIFLFIAAVGKSAQIGLHTWLPDAMEGPTPVSALIHAATMVTAGIFLIIKCSFFIKMSTITLLLISFFGALTVVFAGSVALLQNDMKKIIAYSTCSQLGYMFLICGLSNFMFSFFHLINHAFFKALLFLSSGIIIHAFSDEQDIRKIGGILLLTPVTFCLFVIGSLSIIGFPFLSGYFSKDFILFLSFIFSFISTYLNSDLALTWIINDIIYIFISFGALCTISYSIKILYFTFFNKFNGYYLYFKNAHDLSFLMLFLLSILALGSIFVGFFLKEFIYENILIESLLGTFIYDNTLYFEYIPFSIKIIPLFSILIFFMLFFIFKVDQILFNLVLITQKTIRKYFLFLVNKWFFDKIQNYISQIFYKRVLYSIFFVTDKGYLEIFGPTGIINYIFFLFQNYKSIFLHKTSIFNTNKEFQLFANMVIFNIVRFLFICLLIIVYYVTFFYFEGIYMDPLNVDFAWYFNEYWPLGKVLVNQGILPPEALIPPEGKSLSPVLTEPINTICRMN